MGYNYLYYLLEFVLHFGSYTIKSAGGNEYTMQKVIYDNDVEGMFIIVVDQYNKKCKLTFESLNAIHKEYKANLFV